MRLQQFDCLSYDFNQDMSSSNEIILDKFETSKSCIDLLYRGSWLLLLTHSNSFIIKV